MNEFGKICVVFVTAASLAFVAFAGALRTGGRNWQAEADELNEDFSLTVTPGDSPTYGMTQRATGQNVASNVKLLAEAVTTAKKTQVNTNKDALDKLTKERAVIEPQTKAALDAIVSDTEGLKRREAALVEQVDEVNQKIARISEEILAAVDDVRRIRKLGQERREEGYRLKNQLELLRNDLSVATIQRKNLEEEELRLKEILQRLERRNRQLVESTGSPG